MNNEWPLVSVIVPIYNVAPYLRKCLDSLKNQTMKEIEIICIDDGSTDGSEKIAEEYGVDSRFRIIHTENNGLSAARNRGIDEARADWVMFVDSDDWVEPDFCEPPYMAATEKQADLVVFRSYRESEKGKQSKQMVDAPIGVVDEFAAHEYGHNAAWRRLYKKRLFEKIRYPEGRVFEEIVTTHKVIHEAERILFLREYLYHYKYRKDSISLNPKNKKDEVISWFERSESLISYGYPKEKANVLQCSSAISILAYFDPADEIYKKAIDVLRSFEKMPKGLSIIKMVAFMAWEINERVFFSLCEIKRRRTT